VAGPPHFWPRGGFGHPIPAVWGWPKPPQAFGGGPATPKGQKKKGKNGFWPLGVAGPPPRAWGWLRTPPTGRRGWPKATPRPLGVVRPPPKSQTHFFVFFFFLAFRGGRTTPEGLGWLRPPPYGRYGVADHPLAKNGVVQPTHILGKGWLQPPRFLPLFFFSFFFF
jgi:hypothetical protein